MSENNEKSESSVAEPCPAVKSKGGKWAPAIVIVAGLAVLFGLSQLPKRNTEMTSPPTPPVNVKVSVINPEPILYDTLSLPGTVEPNKVVKVSAEVDGRVERLGPQEIVRDAAGKARVKEGYPVKKGDVLVQLRTDLLQADFDRAEAQRKFDEDDYARISKLFNNKIAAQQEMDTAKTRLDISRSTSEAAKARLDRATIVAPIDGIMNKCPVEKGEYVVPGMCVAQIVDMDTVKVAVQVPELDVAKLKLGQQEKIVAGSDKKELPGTITYISELAEDNSHTTRVELTLDNSKHELRSGQIVQVQLSRGALENVIMIPQDSVIPYEKGYQVFVVENGKAAERIVTLGMIQGRLVQVTNDSLKKGDQLIVDGHRSVSPGQAVAVQSSDDRAATGSSQPAAVSDSIK